MEDILDELEGFGIHCTSDEEAEAVVVFLSLVAQSSKEELDSFISSTLH